LQQGQRSVRDAGGFIVQVRGPSGLREVELKTIQHSRLLEKEHSEQEKAKEVTF
jgi:hypothetical protein